MYFPGQWRSEWKALEGEQGARSILRRLPEVERIPVDDPGVLKDLDRLEDFPAADTLDIASLSFSSADGVRKLSCQERVCLQKKLQAL